MKLTLVVFCVYICFQLGTVTAHEEPSIEELQYSRNIEDDPNLKDAKQLTDTFQFQVAGTSAFKSVKVSLFLHDVKEKVWVEVSVTKSEGKTTCTKNNECKQTITLSKPLIGYDLLKPIRCTEDEFKEQPFVWEKGLDYWEEKEEEPRCYMITLSVNDKSTSQMYPNNCVENETDKDDDEGEAQHQQDVQRRPRNTFGTSITKFTKAKINNDRSFVCKVSHTYMGASTSLGSVIMGAEVKVYHKSRNNDAWGNYQLDLQWSQFAGGEDKFQSLVSKQHLSGQGVKWRKCFKCEITVNGAVTRQCLGNCTCK
jgi:hypothetical protein